MSAKNCFRGFLAFLPLFTGSAAAWAQTNTHLAATTNYVFASVPKSDIEYEDRTEQEFIAFNPDYKSLRADRADKARALAKQVFAREAAGQNILCSHQILFELDWLLSDTADFKKMDGRLRDLEDSLAHPENQAGAGEQDPEDGSWGRCSSEWFFKVNASYDHLAANKNEKPRYAPHFLDRINSPEKLTNYFLSVAVSDIPRNGVDNLREFNESTANLMRLILRDHPAGYAYNPQLKAALTNLFLQRLRNPATGFWGESYVRDGRVQFVDSLSMTFHIISFLGGDVPDLPKVVDHTLAVKDLDYPVGWLRKGHYCNHHEMDVVTLFKFAWPQASAAQKQAMTVEIQKMLHWCLTESLQPDGSFKVDSSDDSIEEGNSNGVSLLSRLGYFDKSERFWTTQDFPEAAGVREKIIANIKKHLASGGAGGAYYQGALKELNSE